MRTNTKARLCLYLFLAALTSAVLLLTGCDKLVSVSSISMKGGQEEISIEVGRFDYSDYFIVILYEDGSRVEEPLKEDYISVEDQFRLYSEGTHEITVRAHMRECKFTLNVGRHTFPSDIGFVPPVGASVEGNAYTVTYTGQPHSVSVAGSLPAGTKVTYSYGNAFTEVKTDGSGKVTPYECRAILTCEGYVTKELSCFLTVSPAAYDMKDVLFEDKDEIFDGKKKSAEISGTLPKGVSVSYRIGGEVGNSAVLVGEYEITALFSGDSRNYLPIPPKTCTLTIGRRTVLTAEYGERFVREVEGAAAVYNSEEHVPFTVSRLPSGVESASVRYLDGAGKTVSEIVNAGVYTVELTLVPSDGANQKLDRDTYTATYTVDKQLIDSTKIYFDNQKVNYDGKRHLLSVVGENIEGLTVTYSAEDKDGNRIEYTAADLASGEVGYDAAGEYRFTATIHENPNYRFTKMEKNATLTIEKISSGFLADSVPNVQTVGYDGQEHALSCPQIPADIRYTLTVNRLDPSAVEIRDAGDYIYRFTFFGRENYTDLPEYAEYCLTVARVPVTIAEKYYKEQTYGFTGDPIPYDAKAPEGFDVSVRYIGTAGDTQPPVSGGDYEVTLTFTRKNYETVTKNTYLHIGTRIVYDTAFASLFASYNGQSAEYTADVFAPFAEQTYTVALGDSSSEFYYEGESLGTVTVRVTYTAVNAGTEEEVTELRLPGTYRIKPVYELNVSGDVYVENSCEEIVYTVTKKAITLEDGTHFTFGYYSGLTFIGENTAGETGEDFRLALDCTDPRIGGTILYDGITLEQGVGSVRAVGAYTVTAHFRSDYYEITVAPLTFTVEPCDVANATFTAASSKQSYNNAKPYNFFSEITVTFNGKTVSGLKFDPANGFSVTWDDMPETLSVEYVMYQINTVSGDWIKDNKNEDPRERMTVPGWGGVYYFEFTLSNGTDEKTVYGFPEHPNYRIGTADSDFGNPAYFCVEIR